MPITPEERRVLVEALEIIERQPDADRKVAALRTFARCVQGLMPDPADIAILKMPKNVRIMQTPPGRA